MYRQKYQHMEFPEAFLLTNTKLCGINLYLANKSLQFQLQAFWSMYQLCIWRQTLPLPLSEGYVVLSCLSMLLCCWVVGVQTGYFFTFSSSTTLQFALFADNSAVIFMFRWNVHVVRIRFYNLILHLTSPHLYSCLICFVAWSPWCC